MRLIPVLSSLMLCAAGYSAHADAVISTDATSFGTVTTVDTAGVTLRGGCGPGSGNPSLIPWSQILLIRFDQQCAPHAVVPPSAGLQKCGQERRAAFKVLFKGLQSPFLALTVRVTEEGKAFLQNFDDSGGISGPKSEIASIQPVKACPVGQPAPEYPKTYCSESKKWAVNWSPLPIFNNQIFTRGSSIYIESVGSPVALPLEDVRFAYQTALSLWAIALQDHKKDLGTEVMKYIDQSTASGGSVNLFTPPQVIRMDCPENALAIVKWYSSRGAVFPEYESDYVAKAQVQGRTILLNANDNRFRGEKEYWKTLGPEDVNLVTVFVHEIGHSFGLPDRFDSEPSVMNPEYVIDRLNQLVSPQEADTFAFAQVLKASIQGSAPGVFNAENCAGLRRKRVHSSRIDDQHSARKGALIATGFTGSWRFVNT